MPAFSIWPTRRPNETADEKKSTHHPFPRLCAAPAFLTTKSRMEVVSCRPASD